MFKLALFAIVVLLVSKPSTLEAASTTKDKCAPAITVTCSNKAPLGVGFNPGCVSATTSNSKPSVLGCAIAPGSAANTTKTLQFSEKGTIALLASVAYKTANTGVDPKDKEPTYACETAKA